VSSVRCSLLGELGMEPERVVEGWGCSPCDLFGRRARGERESRAEMRSGGRRGKQGSSAVRLVGAGWWQRLVASRPRARQPSPSRLWRRAARPLPVMWSSGWRCRSALLPSLHGSTGGWHRGSGGMEPPRRGSGGEVSSDGGSGGLDPGGDGSVDLTAGSMAAAPPLPFFFSRSADDCGGGWRTPGVDGGGGRGWRRQC